MNDADAHAKYGRNPSPGVRAHLRDVGIEVEWPEAEVTTPPPAPPPTRRARLRSLTSGAMMAILQRPLVARAMLATLANSTDKGLGDIVARWAARLGIKETPGCGCSSKRATLNGMWPMKVR